MMGGQSPASGWPGKKGVVKGTIGGTLRRLVEPTGPAVARLGPKWGKIWETSIKDRGGLGRGGKKSSNQRSRTGPCVRLESDGVLDPVWATVPTRRKKKKKKKKNKPGLVVATEGEIACPLVPIGTCIVPS